MFSVVIPFFNEADNLEPLLTELLPVMQSLEEPFELLLVDDSSTDASLDIAKKMAAQDSRIRLLHLDPQQGQSGALAAGFRAVRGETVITLDADLQNDPKDIPRMVELASSYDVVCGIRQERQDSWVRRVSSRIANGIRNRVTGDSIEDVGCSLRVVRSDLLYRVPVFSSMHRFLPTLLRMAGGSVTQVPVRHRPRLGGESKYGIGNRAWRGLVDLCGVRWLQRRHVDFGAAEELTQNSGPSADSG
ncbi:MAG: glycosyltransferase family 2 protein [Acidobacteriota bacterium]|nr:glycosyltransferase family 2 protein [Acidobacteriota bacterium]